MVWRVTFKSVYGPQQDIHICQLETSLVHQKWQFCYYLGYSPLCPSKAMWSSFLLLDTKKHIFFRNVLVTFWYKESEWGTRLSSSKMTKTHRKHFIMHYISSHTICFVLWKGQDLYSRKMLTFSLTLFVMFLRVDERINVPFINNFFLINQMIHKLPVIVIPCIHKQY